MPRWIVSLAAVCCLVLLSLPAAAAETGPKDAKSQSISVAVGEDYAPFYFVNQAGEPMGWLVDIWKLWSQKTGVKVKFVPAPFGQTLKMVKAGKADVQGGCYYSAERAKYLEFVSPLAKATTSYFFHQGIYGINSFEDLLPFRVGVIKGDYAETYLSQKLPGISLVAYGTNQDLFEAVKAGKVRVFVADTPVGIYFLRKYGLFNQFRYYADRPIYSNQFRAAVKKGNTVLPPIIKKGLEEITSAEKVEIAQRWWGGSQTKATEVLRHRLRPQLCPLHPAESLGPAGWHAHRPVAALGRQHRRAH